MIVELDKIKEDEMKRKTIKGYKRRLRLILKSKPNGKNKITAINLWAVAVFRYGGGILQWKESELKNVDRKSRSGGVGAVVRSLPSNPKVPGSIPGSAETGIFGDLLSR